MHAGLKIFLAGVRFPRSLPSYSPPSIPPTPPTAEYIVSNRGRITEYYPHRSLENDTPLATIYRIYVSIASGHTLSMRSEIEYFFRHPSWAVSQIPDPQDPDRKRYAILSAIPSILIPAFNRLIEMGLPRDAPAIIVGLEEEEELKARPKVLETVPSWCEKVPPLEETLLIPDDEGDVPKDKDDEMADPELLRKNVLAYRLHTFFV